MKILFFVLIFERVEKVVVNKWFWCLTVKVYCGREFGLKKIGYGERIWFGKILGIVYGGRIEIFLKEC